ncbi:aspartic peptidase domain-containing protein [Peziza echinospora]|nr:aspartic peptidase domain-containing protein [Peziza echinospora]
MRVPTIVAFGILLASTECLGYGLANEGSLAASGISSKRQQNTTPDDDSSDVPPQPKTEGDDKVQESGNKTRPIYTIELVIPSPTKVPAPMENRNFLSGIPLFPAVFGSDENPVKMNLAISLHSKESWLSSSSSSCNESGCRFLGAQEANLGDFSSPGQPGFNFTVTGQKYNLKLKSETGNLKVENFGIGVAWEPKSNLPKLGPADGVLGLGRDSTFLKALAAGGTDITTASILYHITKSTLVIGGYYPSIVSGNFGKIELLPDSRELKAKVDILFGEKSERAGIDTILDPLYPEIRLPPNVFDNLLVEKGWEAAFIDGVNRTTVPSGRGTLPVQRPIIFVVGGMTISIPVENYMDDFNQPLFTRGDSLEVVLGRPFFRSAYVVTDYSGTGRFWVAQLKTSIDNLGEPKDISGIGEKNEPSTTRISVPGETQISSEDAGNDSKNGNDSASDKKKKPSIAAIAGGVLGGLVFLIAILASILLCLRKRKRKMKEEPKGGYTRATSNTGLRSISPSGSSISHPVGMGPIPGNRAGTSASLYGEPEMGLAPLGGVGGNASSQYTSPNLLPQYTPENTRLMEGYSGFSDSPGQASGGGVGVGGGASSSRQGFYEDTDDDITALRGFTRSESGGGGRRGRDSTGSALSRSMSMNTVSDVDEFESTHRPEATSGRKVPRLPIYTAPARGDGPL